MPFAGLDYISAGTKARALYGKLLTSEDYKSLLERKNVPEVASYLKKNTVYSELLSEINENDVHRGDLEVLFMKSLYDDFVKILYFIRGNAAEFIKVAFFMRREIEDLSMLLSLIYTGRKTQLREGTMTFLERYSTLDYNKLISSKSIDELIHNLKGSKYYKALSFFADNKYQGNIFDMEMALDYYFFTSVIRLKDKLLSGKDRKIADKVFGIEIDLLNIMLIYRCKKLFNLPKELTLNYVIPYWCYLRKPELVRLAESYDVSEFKELVSKTYYGKIFKPDEENMWETNTMNFMYEFYKKLLKGSQMNIGASIAYIHLKEIDIKNIITVIEGIRYSLPKDEIKRYLIGVNR